MSDFASNRPRPPKGVPEVYNHEGGWVVMELRDLHPVAVSSLNAEYDPEDKTSVYHAAGRYYRAAVLSLIFRALDTDAPPAMRHLADLLNANDVPKRRSKQPWTGASVRRLFERTGTTEDFLSYRTQENPGFVRWFEGPDSKVRWCRGPSSLKL